MAGILIQIPFAIGEALAGVLAIFIHDWRVYQYVLSVPIFLLSSLTLSLRNLQDGF